MKSILIACFVPVLLSASSPVPQSRPSVSRATLEADFEKLMSGCKMVGQFTITGSDGPAKDDSYTIAKVTKLGDDKWQFDAKIEYGDKSVTIPIIVDVRWAGDTPMIQVTDMAIPMLGTYSARIVVYQEQYAGMWSGGRHGGRMQGRIVRGDAAPTEPKKNDEPKQDKVAAWGSWRGPENNGVARDATPPTEWAEDKNIRWKVDLPGLGNSTPVIWGDRIYVTTAVNTEVKAEEPEGASGATTTDPADGGDGAGRGGRRGGDQAGRGGRRGGRGGRRGRGGFGRNTPPPTEVYEFLVLALDRSDGRVVWSTAVTTEVPHERGHATATQASNSPITDGEHIYASFGSRGLYCLNMDGEVQWSKRFGKMRTRLGFGEGSSPALYGDTLVINWDHEGDSFLAAFDKRSGEELWRTPRDEGTSWSTPLIVPVDGSPQVIITATKATRSYDLETGELIWSATGMTTNPIPSPIHADGLAYLMSGFRGSSLQVIELSGADGDISDSDRIIWTHNRNTSYTPSALLYDDFIYFLRSNNGVLSCLDAKTGEVHYEGQRLPGIRSIYSSPLGAGGYVYVTSREGTTKVIKLGSEYVEVATNTLEDGFDASAIAVGNELYLRGREHLYCIAEK